MVKHQVVIRSFKHADSKSGLNFGLALLPHGVLTILLSKLLVTLSVPGHTLSFQVIQIFQNIHPCTIPPELTGISLCQAVENLQKKFVCKFYRTEKGHPVATTVARTLKTMQLLYHNKHLCIYFAYLITLIIDL